MKRPRLSALVTLCLACVSGCSTGPPSVDLSSSAAPSVGGVKRPSTIYVADFYLDPAGSG